MAALLAYYVPRLSSLDMSAGWWHITAAARRHRQRDRVSLSPKMIIVEQFLGDKQKRGIPEPPRILGFQ